VHDDTTLGEKVEEGRCCRGFVGTEVERDE